MRTAILKISLALGMAWQGFVGVSMAADKAEDAKKEQGLSTNMSFEDLLVQGKYHFSDEAVATVEEDKVLDALLGIRKDFKDRIKRSASRH